MALLLGAWTTGLIMALMALGVYVSFRVFRFSDITVDGSITLGAAVAAILLTEGFHPLLQGLAGWGLWPAGWVPAAAGLNPWLATGVAFLTGGLAGAVTGLLHTKFKINQLLSGILVMTALYSINLRVMGKSNLSLGGATTLSKHAEAFGQQLTGEQERVWLLGWEVSVQDLMMFLLSVCGALAIGLLLYVFFKTDLGTSMRATGDNDQMIRALGVNVDRMIIAGLALANGLVALAGALMAQYQGFADVQMGIGMVVMGLASVIIGEALVGGQHHLGLAITGVIMGSLLYRLMVALVLRFGLNPNDLKLITSVFVFCALITPQVSAAVGRALTRRREQHA